MRPLAARATRSVAAALLGATLAVAAAGCGSSPSHASCPAHGVLYLSWTIRMLDATSASCAAAHVDHLTLQMATPCGDVEIDPIPCISGAHWEYDNLPEGTSDVTLFGVDAHNNVVVEGIAPVTLSTTRPDTPAPIDLE